MTGAVRAFDQVRKVLGVQIKMHHRHRQIDTGDIFLYNHFSRVETFIPQYLIYHETGEFCRSIAAAEFFKGSDRFANALRDLGVVPKITRTSWSYWRRYLKGRKIVVFRKEAWSRIDRSSINAVATMVLAPCE